MSFVQLVENKIAVIPLEDSSRTRGGLFLPDQAIQRIDQGVIKYIGPKVKELKIGDHVLFSAYAGTQVAIDEEGILLIMREELVEAIINDDEPPIPIISTGRLFRILEEVHNEWLLSHFGTDQKALNSVDSYKLDVIQYIQNLTWGEDFEF